MGSLGRRNSISSVAPTKLDLPMGSLGRRNSISSMVTTKLDLPSKAHHPQSSSFPIAGDKRYPAVDFELVALTIRPLSYTSLKDLITSSSSSLGVGLCPSSPGVATHSCHDISIRNRLVKQAAWAYLQPMAASPDSAGRDFFRRVWVRICSPGHFRNPVSACLSFLNRHVIPTIARAIGRLLDVFRPARKASAVL
ncbi:uncharacterized protein LOC131234807 [Magnolia sinica]|uniref:uncharacterized protein LOC131234807 n=1 Tax=Magnolia sinica TaxID=86752 RepID=UPI00265ABDCE|nr:uncharacterized protein LOC131234807 [Magnolia sinica]